MNTLPINVEPGWTFAEHADINFLLLCLSANTDSHTTTKIKTLARGEIDWNNVIKIAEDNRVLLLLYNRISTVCPNDVPTDLLKALRQSCQVLTFKNLSMTAELRRLLQLMTSSGIDTLPYKGPVLAQTLYERLDLRQFGDLDIIIQPQDMLAVEQLLIDEGYRPYFGEKTRVELAAYMKAKTEHTYDFFHERKRVFVEVHWRFWPPFFSSVNPKEVWHRREMASIGSTTVHNLGIEDYLVVLCMHGSRHMWQRLAWLCDIAVLIHKYPKLDWQQAIATAEQWGSKRMLYLGLYLAHQWLGASLPKAIIVQISADSSVIELAKRVDSQMFKLPKAPARFMETTRYQIQARERWSDKAVYVQSFIHWLLQGLRSKAHTV